MITNADFQATLATFDPALPVVYKTSSGEYQVPGDPFEGKIMELDALPVLFVTFKIDPTMGTYYSK